MRLIFVSSLRIVGEKQVRRPGDVRDPFVHGGDSSTGVFSE